VSGQRGRLERESAFFDRLVEEEGDFNPFTERGWGTVARCFELLVEPAGRLDVLDIGCGTGQSHRLYSAHARSYVGVDLSGGALRRARKEIPGVSWIRADATRTPFAVESFDVVCFSSVLHHVENFVVALEEARRVSRPGGAVFAFDPNLLHPAMALLRWRKSPFYLAEGVSPDEEPFLPSTLRRGFEAAGFVDVRQRCQSDIPYREVAPRLVNAALSVYNVVDWAWQRVGLGRWFGSFVITSGRKPSEMQAT
jgi:SAM-dependent methyltransferase